MTVYDIIKELGITKGWSPLYGDCEIELNTGKIWIRNKDCGWTTLNEDGKFYEEGECLVFPSKEERNWVLLLNKKRNQLLPINTPVMISEDGSYWSLRYYKNYRKCSGLKENKGGPKCKYIVPVSKFDFEADDLFINIKNSI